MGEETRMCDGGESVEDRGLPNRRSNMKRTPRHDHLLPPPTSMLG